MQIPCGLYRAVPNGHFIALFPKAGGPTTKPAFLIGRIEGVPHVCTPERAPEHWPTWTPETAQAKKAKQIRLSDDAEKDERLLRALLISLLPRDVGQKTKQRATF